MNAVQLSSGQQAARIADAFRLADELAASSRQYHAAADRLNAMRRKIVADRAAAGRAAGDAGQPPPDTAEADWQEQYLAAEFIRRAGEGNALGARGQMIRGQAGQAGRVQAAAGCAAEVAAALGARPPLPELPPLVLSACSACAAVYGLTYQPGGCEMPGDNGFTCPRCTAAEAPAVIVPRRFSYALRDSAPGSRWVVLRQLGAGMCEIRRLGFPDAPSFTVHSSGLAGGRP